MQVFALAQDVGCKYSQNDEEIELGRDPALLLYSEIA